MVCSAMPVIISTTSPILWAALSVAYGAGLRASVVVSLKLADIVTERMVIRVEQGKGRKDRYAMLSEPLLLLLRAWPAGRRPSKPCAGASSRSPCISKSLNPASRSPCLRPIPFSPT
jgi:integrase